MQHPKKKSENTTKKTQVHNIKKKVKYDKRKHTNKNK